MEIPVAILTTEHTEARIRGTPKTARKSPSDISLTFVHFQFFGILNEGDLRLKCVKPLFLSQFRAAHECVSEYSVVKISTKNFEAPIVP